MGATAEGPAAPLEVLAAGSLRPAFDVFAAASPGSLALAYANARDLAERILARAPADVFASASPGHPAKLHAAGLADAPVPFASNRLVVAVPAASAATDPGVLAACGTRVAIEVAGIPLGDYTRELLARLDAGFAMAVMANVVAQEQTVDAVAALLLAGAADAAVLYATDVAALPGKLRAIALPAAAAGVAVSCVACVVSASTRHARATEWIAELNGAAAQTTLAAAGFGPPRAHA